MLSSAPEAVEAAVAELVYHDRVLEALGLDASHKIVLHVGSGAGDASAAARLRASVAALPAGPRSRLVLENDERWTLAAVLTIGADCAAPAVFNEFHHRLAPSLEGVGLPELAELRRRSTER